MHMEDKVPTFCFLGELDLVVSEELEEDVEGCNWSGEASILSKSALEITVVKSLNSGSSASATRSLLALETRGVFTLTVLGIGTVFR